jgi:RNA polymerase sigma-70 factor (ECF subfamily)
MTYHSPETAAEKAQAVESPATGPHPGLAPAARSHVHEEFEHVARRYERDFQARAFGLTRSRADAADLVQRTLERGFRCLDRFEPGTNMRCWLSRILLNLFLDDCRRASSGPRMESLVDHTEASTTAEEVSEADRPWDRITVEQVRTALTRLKPPFREVYELRIVNKLGYDEISRRLNIPIGTVATRLLRGRKMLHELLSALAVEREDVDR